MTSLETGIAAFHGRVQSWECDFNGHWNSRFYARAFQTAAEVAASLAGRADVIDGMIPVWHCRFHNELLSGDSIEVRVFALVRPGEEIAIALCLHQQGAIAATALGFGKVADLALPELPGGLAPLVLPRGLGPDLSQIRPPEPAADHLVQLGPVRPAEVDRVDNLNFETALDRVAIASHLHVGRMGYTREFTRRTGVGRMLIELRYTRLGPSPTGSFLTGTSRLTGAKGKAFTTAHAFHTHEGKEVAIAELCSLAVDMTTRKAIDIPDFLK